MLDSECAPHSFLRDLLTAEQMEDLRAQLVQKAERFHNAARNAKEKFKVFRVLNRRRDAKMSLVRD